jgi:hypothetical protein
MRKTQLLAMQKVSKVLASTEAVCLMSYNWAYAKLSLFPAYQLLAVDRLAGAYLAQILGPTYGLG